MFHRTYKTQHKVILLTMTYDSKRTCVKSAEWKGTQGEAQKKFSQSILLAESHMKCIPGITLESMPEVCTGDRFSSTLCLAHKNVRFPCGKKDVQYKIYCLYKKIRIVILTSSENGRLSSKLQVPWSQISPTLQTDFLINSFLLSQVFASPLSPLQSMFFVTARLIFSHL